VVVKTDEDYTLAQDFEYLMGKVKDCAVEPLFHLISRFNLFRS